MKIILTRLVVAVVLGAWLGLPAVASEAKSVKLTTTADHSKFKELDKAFSSGPEVTQTCLGCHTEAAGQIHRTKHWKWEYLNPDTKQTLGKKTILNNFCIRNLRLYFHPTSLASFRTKLLPFVINESVPHLGLG